VTREQYDQIRTAAEAARSNLAASRSSAEAARSAIETVKSNIEAARANIEAARASQAATEAAIGNAKVQLGYTTIRSPVSGQAGSLLAKIGDYVKGNGDTQLVVINQMQPILVRFPVPEADLPNVQRYRKEGALSVRVELPGGGLRDGSVVFVDNAVDRTTGTIAMKARFDNADLGLWPGQFANVHLLLFTRKDAVVVPSAAVQTGQKGPYVFVVDAEGTATMRPVKPGLSRENLTIVEEGLKAGETIVTDGHLKVTPGAKVQAKNGSGADASPAPQAAQGSAK
jgi:multidrug efflux system membrane fusion protein